MINLESAWLLILFVSSNLVCDADSQSYCPSQCITCLPTALSCISGGMLTIPVQIQPGTENITLSQQFHFHGVLTSSNFSHWTPPKFIIKVLAIRASSIQELRSKTFSQLVYLKTLDLSENQRLTIFSATFDGLQLAHLKLDDIGKLMLMPGCFDGLMTETLSMKNSRLQMLNYEMFAPLSHTLKHLFIENNQIRTLDQKFEPLFYRLESVNLRDNPLICYCPLLWLSKALRSKMASSKYQSNAEDVYPNFNDASNYPKCVAPSNFRNRQLQTITETEFNCQIPQISQIDIDILSMENGEMSCRIKPAEKGHKIPTKVFWHEGTDSYRQINRQIQTSSDRLSQEDTDGNDSVATVKIDSSGLTRKRNFNCIAENTVGKSTLAVQISWPTQSVLNKSRASKNESMSPEKSDSSNIPPTFNNITPESYFFTKHYTLLEMTVAIIGTFIVTVIIFLIFYRIYFRRKNGYKSGKSSLKYPLAAGSPNGNKRSLMAFHSPRSGYTVYETSLHYSDNSQTYDSIPHNSVYPTQQQQPLFSSLSNSPSAHFIDYKTQKSLYPRSPSSPGSN